MKKFKSFFTKIGVSISAIFLTIYNYVLAINPNAQVLYGVYDEPTYYSALDVILKFIFLIIAIILGIFAIFNKNKNVKLLLSIIAILLLILFIVLMFI